MGWVFREGLSRKDLVNERIHRQWPSGYSGLCMARSLRGNVLWTVWELSRPDGGKGRFIGCDLLGRSRGRGWGYQEMEESGDPCFHSCPLAYLDLVPAANEKWRKGVREYHRERNTKRRAIKDLRIGETVPLQHCEIPEALIVSLNPLQGYYCGRIYELRRQFIYAESL
jgi:hypothetical protein